MADSEPTEPVVPETVELEIGGTLDDLCDGAVTELFIDAEMKVAANILDLNTKATAKRKIVIEVTYEPTESRKELRKTVTVLPKLAGNEPVKAHAYVGRENGVIKITEFDPEQPMLFNTPLRGVRAPKKRPSGA